MTSREAWAAYEGAWSETDPGKRAEVLRQTLDETFFYCDPSTQAESHSALSQYIDGLQRIIPGLSIVTTSYAEHYDTCLVSWTLRDGYNTTVTSGMTFGEFLSNGLLKKATVFYDPPQGA